MTFGVAPANAQAPGDCAAPAAITVTPGTDIQSALDDAGEDATICFARGMYRLTEQLVPSAGQSLIGDGAVLSGARVLRDFTRTESGWTVGGQTQEGERHGECAGESTTCRYPDDVLRNGRPLVRVLSAAELTGGTYHFDYDRDTITVFDRPTASTLLAMVSRAAIVSGPGTSVADVTVRGFTVQHFATLAQRGAIATSAPGWVIRGNTVQVNHGAGVSSNGGTTITGNRVLHNGQLGINGSGSGAIVVTDNEIAYNNTGGFDAAWEAGGAKWAVTDELRVERNRVQYNKGPGLWTDIDAQNTVYADNIVTGNRDAGIFHEISGAATITGNTVRGNGFGFDAWLWGSGILIAGSHDVEVTGNIVDTNAQGIGLIQQDRGVSEVDGEPRTLHDIAISGNVVTTGGGLSGGVTDNGFDQMFTDPTITWTGNTWLQSSGTPFEWDGRELDAAAWRALGHDVDGVFD